MSRKVVFHPSASAEFIDASAWYEGKRHGLALEFMAEIEHCVKRAANQPLQCPLVHNDIRRVTAKRFPYNVYFKVETHRIVVLAVLHARRDPAAVSHRI